MPTLTTQYKKGIIKLAALIGLLCCFIMGSKFIKSQEPAFLLNEEGQCFIDNQRYIQEEESVKKKYKYYINSINDFQAYQLGLSVEQIDRLFAYRNSNKSIYTLEDFKNIIKANVVQLDTIKDQLVFAVKKKTVKHKKVLEEKNAISFKKLDINKVTSAQLYVKLKLPSIIANRIIKYRKSLKGFKSMDQLKNVYDITEEHLELLNINYKIY